MSTSPRTGPSKLQPCARLCHVIQWPNFPGFGFHLASKFDRSGYFIEGIVDGSPASYSGLRNDDKIIEVNQELVTSLSRAKVSGRFNFILAFIAAAQVAKRIKNSPGGELTLLVVDAEAEKWYTQQGLSYSDRKLFISTRSPSSKPPTNVNLHRLYPSLSNLYLEEYVNMTQLQ